MFRLSTRLYTVRSIMKSSVSLSRPTTLAWRLLASVAKAISPKCCPSTMMFTQGPNVACGLTGRPFHTTFLISSSSTSSASTLYTATEPFRIV